jgi:hypothetical protein
MCEVAEEGTLVRGLLFLGREEEVAALERLCRFAQGCMEYVGIFNVLHASMARIYDLYRQ